MGEYRELRHMRVHIDIRWQFAERGRIDQVTDSHHDVSRPIRR